MKYNNIGNSGLKTSIIGFGKIINPKIQAYQENKNLIKKCLEVGINHFDTSEFYGYGQCQKALGEILKDLKVQRQSIIASTKIRTGYDADINSTSNLNKKHIKQGLKASLKRLQLQYVDIIYAHLYDAETPMEQYVRGFHEVIEQGLAFYWAISNWDADCVFNAFQICEKYNLHKPICAQMQYSMLYRKQVETDYHNLFNKYNLGLISWGSVAGGFLSGKHLDGISNQQGNKFKDKFYQDLYYTRFNNQKTINAVKSVKKIAEQQLQCSLVIAALAWCLKYKNLSSALIGTRKVSQLEQTLKALQIMDKLTPSIEGRINKILDLNPQARINFLNWTSYEHQRPLHKQEIRLC